MPLSRCAIGLLLSPLLAATAGIDAIGAPVDAAEDPTVVNDHPATLHELESALREQVERAFRLAIRPHAAISDGSDRGDFSHADAWSLAFGEAPSEASFLYTGGVASAIPARPGPEPAAGLPIGATRPILDDVMTTPDLLSAAGPSGFSGSLNLDDGQALSASLPTEPAIQPSSSSSFLEWRPVIDDDQRWSLNLGSESRGMSNVKGLSIGYDASEKLSFSSSFGLAETVHDFRLDTTGGVGPRRSMPLVAGIDWSPRPGVHMSGYAGASLFGDVELFDRGRDALSGLNLDPAPVLGFDLSLSF